MILSAEQVKPVHSDSKYNVCCAVPGSGKTTVLVARAERLAKSNDKVLIVTFSNKAATEVEHRVPAKYKQNITVKTIHAYCYDIIKNNWGLLGEYFGYDEWPETSTLANELIEKELYVSLYGDNSFKQFYKNLEFVRSLGIDMTLIPNLLTKGVYFGNIRLCDIEKCIKFEHYRFSKGVILFDDMISLVGRILQLPNITSRLIANYDHLLVDEAQDTNQAQWDVLRVMIYHCKTSLIVGDVNQAIYGFRGAEGSGFKYFINLPSAVIFTLKRTYRSKSKIVEFANKIVPNKISQIIANKDGGFVKIVKYDDSAHEIDSVTSNIQGNTCIIARTNDYLIPFELKLIEKGIGYCGDSFYRNPLLGKILEDIDPENALSSVRSRLNEPTTTDDEIKVLRNIKKALKHGKTIQDIYDTKEASQSLIDSYVALSTGHAAKGLEWNHVRIVGANVGMIPHKLATDITEEKNLFYVMATRGKESVEVSYTDIPSEFIKEHI